MKNFDFIYPKATKKDYIVIGGLYGLLIIIYIIGLFFILWYDEIRTWTEEPIKKIKAKLPWCS